MLITRTKVTMKTWSAPRGHSSFILGESIVFPKDIEVYITDIRN